MMASASELPETLTPSESESQQASESSRRLAKILGSNRQRKSLPIRIQLDDEAAETITIPMSAFRMLNDILTEMAKGNALTLIPLHAELTTQQAADVLNVSRPYLVKLLEEKQIPFHKAGTHRRVLFSDVMAYKKRIDAERLKTLEKLAALDQELGLGY
jgi:excisionase family DNA binding protein